jgi:hypothetical protein
MAAKKTAKKSTKTKGRTRAKSAKKPAAKKDNFRTFSTLSRVDAARKNRTLPRGTVVKIETTDTMRDDMEHVKVKIGTPKKGTMIEFALPEFIRQSIKLMGFAQDDDATLPDFGTPVSAN